MTEHIETVRFSHQSMGQVAGLIENPPAPTDALRRLWEQGKETGNG